MARHFKISQKHNNSMPNKLSEIRSLGFLPSLPCQEVMCRDLKALQACCWEFKDPLHGILRPGDWGKVGLVVEKVTLPRRIVHGLAIVKENDFLEIVCEEIKSERDSMGFFPALPHEKWKCLLFSPYIHNS